MKTSWMALGWVGWLGALAGCRGATIEAPDRVPLAKPVTTRERSVREIKVKSELPYLLTLPRGYVEASAQRWPLVLFLHGMGERGEDLALVEKHGPPKLIAAGREFPAIVVSPQCPVQSQFGWSTAAVLALLDDVMEQFFDESGMNFVAAC